MLLRYAPKMNIEDLQLMAGSTGCLLLILVPVGAALLYKLIFA